MKVSTTSSATTPYIEWGNCVQPHEKFKKNLTLEQADSLLRSDLNLLRNVPQVRKGFVVISGTCLQCGAV